MVEAIAEINAATERGRALDAMQDLDGHRRQDRDIVSSIDQSQEIIALKHETEVLAAQRVELLRR
ncbi:hypothetical protein OE766_13440 [Pararhizobium sp. YC-54]|uniref:hypothetical protein n=1 Tax=Pararhizobium sp. YC-54 TaxID=2986920 RepID=UPI0021F7A970|nr:hypothetical protein [Pararhizobium sp. YC-54]MCV9999254.1 hypothetical protein [Pararhizobium sp. YC-54]